jgi:molybdopterin converting factor small subunit
MVIWDPRTASGILQALLSGWLKSPDPREPEEVLEEELGEELEALEEELEEALEEELEELEEDSLVLFELRGLEVGVWLKPYIDLRRCKEGGAILVGW